MEQVLTHVKVFYTASRECQMAEDFNNVKVWMEGKLRDRGLSTSRLTHLTGYKISSASVFRWYNDTFRPTENNMQLICDTLNRVPLVTNSATPKFQEVPLAEGMAQFSKRPWKNRTKQTR